MEAQYPKIALQGMTGLMFVHKTDILCAIADGNYTHVCLTQNRKVKVQRKLKEVDQLLAEENFVRIHRSHLINLEHVVRFENQSSEAVYLSDGTQLVVSRNRKTNFIERFTRI